MRRKSTTCSRCSHRAGLTLIEVVAAIAILGTILVGIVLAKSRHTRQLALSQRRAQAVLIADELITNWWISEDGVPVNQSGRIEDDPTLRWQTRTVTNRPLNALGVRVVRVELQQIGDPLPYAKEGDERLVAVDLVLPDPAYDQARAQQIEDIFQSTLPGSEGGAS